MAQGQTHGGKGSAVRPTDKKKYEDNWDSIFGKKKEKQEEVQLELDLNIKEKEKSDEHSK